MNQTSNSFRCNKLKLKIFVKCNCICIDNHLTTIPEENDYLWLPKMFCQPFSFLVFRRRDINPQHNCVVSFLFGFFNYFFLIWSPVYRQFYYSQIVTKTFVCKIKCIKLMELYSNTQMSVGKSIIYIAHNKNSRLFSY